MREQYRGTRRNRKLAPVAGDTGLAFADKRPWPESRLPGHGHNQPTRTGHGTIFVAGSLHGPGPTAPMARTRTQTRCPDVNPVSTAFDAVGVAACV
jgi:hypothetical protein